MPTPAQRIIWAVRTRNHSRLRELLLRPGHLTAVSPAGRTALHAAAEVGDLVAVRCLLEAGADVNVRAGDGETPLHRAACCGKRFLCFDDAEGRDAFRFRRRFPRKVAEGILAILKEQSPTLPAELGLTHDLDGATKMDALFALLELKPEVLFGGLLARGIDLDLVDPVFADELRGSPRFVPVAECLLDYGANILARTESGATPLGHAVELGTPGLVKLFLEHGGASREQLSGTIGLELLKLALDRNASESAELLLKHGVPFTEKQSYLTEAASNLRLGIVNWLLDHGADVNAPNEYGTAPLIAAHGHHEIIACLLWRGADSAVRDENGNGLLHQAAPWPECLKVVLPLGLPLEQVNAKGRTPLHLAAQSGADDGVQILLHAGAYVNAQDIGGNTALHLIFDSEEFRPDIEFPVFLVLVEANADLSLRNRDGKTAYDLAVRWHYPEEYLWLLNPERSAATPERFLWLGSKGCELLLPRGSIAIEADGQIWPSSQNYFESRKADLLGRSLSWACHCDDVMQEALRMKFAQHPALRDQLIATGEVVLVSDASCEGMWGGYWAERPGVQFNTIGKMLMALRAELRFKTREQPHEPN